MIPLPAALVANWKAVLGGLLLAALALQTWRIGELKYDVEACEGRNLAQVSEWRAKYAEAVVEATRTKARIETEQAKVTTELSNDYQKRLAAFLAAYNQRMRQASANNTSRAGEAADSKLSYDPAVLDGPGGSITISEDDARLCGVNTLRLIAAREWALQQSQIDRGNE